MRRWELRQPSVTQKEYSRSSKRLFTRKYSQHVPARRYIHLHVVARARLFLKNLIFWRVCLPATLSRRKWHTRRWYWGWWECLSTQAALSDCARAQGVLKEESPNPVPPAEAADSVRNSQPIQPDDRIRVQSTLELRTSCSPTPHSIRKTTDSPTLYTILKPDRKTNRKRLMAARYRKF